jgi:hypothetical protein
MTYRNQIWKRANQSNESKCLAMLRKIFPSLSYDFIVTESGLTRSDVDTKSEALKRIRLGLNKITEIEAQYYISLLDTKQRTSQIKY